MATVHVQKTLTIDLVYIGDASTLSILQLIRIIVENTAGTDMGSPFINDPKRHRIMENIIDFPEGMKVPSFLPDRVTADVLIESFFVNVRVRKSRILLDEIKLIISRPVALSRYSIGNRFSMA